MADTNAIVDALNDLLQKNVDARQGYEKARDDVEQDILKTYLTDKASQRQVFTNALQREITALGGTPKRETTFKGNLHHAWIDLKSSLSSNDEEAVFEECVRGEKNSLKTYDKLLQNTTWPASTQEMLTQQRNQIAADLERAASLEEALD